MAIVYPVISTNHIEDEEVIIEGTSKSLEALNLIDKIDKSWISFFQTYNLNKLMKAIYLRAYKNNLSIKPNVEDIYNVFSMPLSVLKLLL